MSDVAGDTAARSVLARARAAAGSSPGGQVGTEHLLAFIATRGPAAAALDAVDVTAPVVHTVIMNRRDDWVSADDAEPEPKPPAELTGARGGSVAFTPAAGAAIGRTISSAAAAGKASYSPTDILLALLDDPASRATELLHTCGVDIPGLRSALGTDRPLPVGDRLDIELRRTRDFLIGRLRYRGRGMVDRLLSAVVRIRINYGAVPVMWAVLEADEQAGQRGRRRPGTDDLLLAMLATHEVAQRYPHLSGPAHDRYDGGQRLAAAGTSYRDARRVAQNSDLGADPRPLRDPAPRGENFPQDTGTLLRNLLVDQDNRATRLLAALGVNVAAL